MSAASAPAAAAPAPLRPVEDSRTLSLRLLCGGAAGVVEKTCTAPLERTKILFQVQGMDAGAKKYHTILQTLGLVWREEGLRGWYRGNGANVLRVIPVYGLKFSFNDYFKQIVGADTPNTPLSTSQLMLSGTLAGLFQQLTTYPIELVRTRLSVGAALTPPLFYKGIVDCAVSTVRKEGFGALYKGLAVTLMSGAPLVGLQMTSYAELTARAPRNADGSLALVWMLGAGAFAGIFSQTITFPGDTIRRRMQTNGANGAPRVYKNSWDCTLKIARLEGYRAFYKGWATNTTRAIPGTSLQFAAYETFKKLVGLDR